MNISPEAVSFNEGSLTVCLSDGRKISVPLAWFPRLLHASPEQRLQVALSRHGLHWDALDENLSVAGLLAGTPDLTHAATQA
jgi:hypothetical protein